MVQSTAELLIFALDYERFGLLSADVVEVVRAVLIAPLPKAPPIIEGVINLRGAVIPVLDIRQRFHLPVRPLDEADQLIVARTAQRTVALRVDRALDLITVDNTDLIEAARIPSVGDYVAGIVKLPDGLVIIHDLETFLSKTESESLAALGA